MELVRCSIWLWMDTPTSGIEAALVVVDLLLCGWRDREREKKEADGKAGSIGPLAAVRAPRERERELGLFNFGEKNRVVLLVPHNFINIPHT